MLNGEKTKKPHIILPSRVLFKIDATRPHVRAGDYVTEETAVGEEIGTGQTVRARCRGHVETIHFVGADRSLLIEVLPARRISYPQAN
jgi:hypothetical protein